MPETVGEIVTLEPFVVNLADPKGNRYLKMKISLELETLTAADKVQKVTPKLRDIVIMMLTSLSFEEVMTPEGKLRIRDELLERFNRVTRHALTKSKISTFPNSLCSNAHTQQNRHFATN